MDYLHPPSKLKKQSRNGQWGSNPRPRALKTVTGSSDTEADTDAEMGAGCTSVSKKTQKYSIIFLSKTYLLHTILKIQYIIT